MDFWRHVLEAHRGDRVRLDTSRTEAERLRPGVGARYGGLARNVDGP